MGVGVSVGVGVGVGVDSIFCHLREDHIGGYCLPESWVLIFFYTGV